MGGETVMKSKVERKEKQIGWKHRSATGNQQD